MTTIVDVVLNGTEPKQTARNPIQFSKFVNEQRGNLEDNPGLRQPKSFKYLSLLVPVSTNGAYDIIMAWDHNDRPEARCMYLGHWNDGVV